MYATQALGFSRSKTAQFIRLAGVMEELPVLRKAVTCGELTWTKAREVAKVATPKTEERWVAEASRSSNRELEKKVATVRKQAKTRSARGNGGQQVLCLPDEAPGEALEAEIPVSVSLRFSPEQFARWEAMLEKIRKQTGCQGDSREELVLAALADLVETTGKGPGTRPAAVTAPRVHSTSPYQIVIYKCGSCTRAHVATSRGEQRLTRAALAAALCDAQVLGADKRNKSTIPPAKRRLALARARHRCEMPGCNHRHFLEVHHLVPRERGDGNNLDNLVVLCSSCHRLLHERKDQGGFQPGKKGKTRQAFLNQPSGSR